MSHLYKYKILNMYVSFVSIYLSKFTLSEQCPRIQLFSPSLSPKSKVLTHGVSESGVIEKHLINLNDLADKVGNNQVYRNFKSIGLSVLT